MRNIEEKERTADVVATCSGSPLSLDSPPPEKSQESKMAVNGPVFFLIREQAKSVVAIKEIQARMTVLENIQQRLMLAIQNVQQHLVCSEENNPESCHTNYLSASGHPAIELLPDSEDQLSRDHPSARKELFFNIAAPSPQSADHFTKDVALYEGNGTQCSSPVINHHVMHTKENGSHMVPESKCDSKHGDSFNKDSGVDSDYREQGSNSSFPPLSSPLCHRPLSKSGSDDELLHLLDMIDQKGHHLRQQVEEIEKQKKTIQEMDGTVQNKGVMLDSLLAEKVDTQRQLCEMKADRDNLRQRLAQLECATDTVESEKKKLQQKLDSMMQEKQHLEVKIHGFQGQHTKPQLETKDDNCMRASVREPMKRNSIGEMGGEKVKGKYLNSDESRRKVSLVLKENSVLELQRQLLTYIMENDVLHAKLEKEHPGRVSKWEKAEAKLKQEMKKVLQDKEELQLQLEESRMELTALRDRVRALEKALTEIHQEKCVKNFGLGSTDDWRQMTSTKRGNPNNTTFYSAMDFGDFSKTQSLPAMLYLDMQGKSQSKQSNEFAHGYNTESFTDVSLNRSSSSNKMSNVCENPSEVKDLVDLNDAQHNCCSSDLSPHSAFWNNPTIPVGCSTPSSCCRVHSQEYQNHGWNYIHSGTPRSDCSNKVGNSQAWNQQSNDLDSICSEFDPLSESPSCEKFIDSLNLSIPLKPTQMSQLSSIGDSLHSASLDLGCASTGLWHGTPNLPNARSVDGIRQIVVDNSIHNYYKGRTFPRYGQTTHVPGKNGRALPMNIMDCLHGSPDYTLL